MQLRRRAMPLMRMIVCVFVVFFGVQTNLGGGNVRHAEMLGLFAIVKIVAVLVMMHSYVVTEC